MLTVKVLGPGCPRCYSVEHAALAALDEIEREYPQLQATLQHVTDPQTIQAYAVLATPGLVINERLVCAGRIPTKREVVAWLRAALPDLSEARR